jgi:hypothetical protein
MANELPRESERELIDGKVPITQAEWDGKPKDYKYYSEEMKSETIIFWNAKSGGTTLAPIVIVEEARIKTKSVDK